MSEVDIVFISVASIHPFCSENALIFFWETTAPPLHVCGVTLIKIACAPLAWTVTLSLELRQNKDKLPVTHPSGRLPTGVMDIIYLVSHPLAD